MGREGIIIRASVHRKHPIVGRDYKRDSRVSKKRCTRPKTHAHTHTTNTLSGEQEKRGTSEEKKGVVVRVVFCFYSHRVISLPSWMAVVPVSSILGGGGVASTECDEDGRPPIVPELRDHESGVGVVDSL